MDTTRVFVAIDLGESARLQINRDLQDAQRRLPGVRWTQADQLHITLKFLGEVENTLLPKACDLMTTAVSGTAPFQIKTGGLAAFPTEETPKVLWARVGEGGEELVTIHTLLDDAFAEIGIPSEPRQFTPHLTLGRTLKDFSSDDYHQQREKLKTRFHAAIDVSKIVLMSSERERGRYVYHPMSSVQLG